MEVSWEVVRFIMFSWYPVGLLFCILSKRLDNTFYNNKTELSILSVYGYFVPSTLFVYWLKLKFLRGRYATEN